MLMGTDVIKNVIVTGCPFPARKLRCIVIFPGSREEILIPAKLKRRFVLRRAVIPTHLYALCFCLHGLNVFVLHPEGRSWKNYCNVKRRPMCCCAYSGSGRGISAAWNSIVNYGVNGWQKNSAIPERSIAISSGYYSKNNLIHYRIARIVFPAIVMRPPNPAHLHYAIPAWKQRFFPISTNYTAGQTIHSTLTISVNPVPRGCLNPGKRKLLLFQKHLRKRKKKFLNDKRNSCGKV